MIFEDRSKLRDLYLRLLDHAVVNLSARNILTFPVEKLTGNFLGVVLTESKTHQGRRYGASGKQLSVLVVGFARIPCICRTSGEVHYDTYCPLDAMPASTRPEKTMSVCSRRCSPVLTAAGFHNCDIRESLTEDGMTKHRSRHRITDLTKS